MAIPSGLLRLYSFTPRRDGNQRLAKANETINHVGVITPKGADGSGTSWLILFNRHLKPGGWVELQEIHHFPMGQHDRPISLNDPIAQYWSSIREGLSTLGVDSDIIASGELPAMMREAGFVNVKEQVIKIPLGTWPEGQVLKTVGLYWRTILLDGLQAIGMGPLTRGLRWSPEAVELFLVQVRRAYLEDTTGIYMPFHIICGQKPA